MNLALYEQQVPRLLVIDDDTGITSLFETITEDLHFSVKCVNDFESIGSTLASFDPDIIFLDLRLPGYDGIEVLQYFAEVGCKAKIFLISGVDQGTLEAAGEVGKLHKLNILGTIKKPFDLDDIEKILKDKVDTTSSFSNQVLQNLFGTGEFRILFQPCMAIKSLGGMGVHDLDTSVNWYGQTGAAFVASQSVIPRLESRGLIAQFSHGLLEKCFESLNFWTIRGMEAGVVIRVHHSMYRDSSFPGYVLDLTRKWEVSPASITLGVEDSELMEHADSMLDVLTRLRINGFNISVRVGNTSSSELERLLHLPINEIRLAAKLINGIAGSVDHEIDVCSFISQCDKRGLRTRAEGIESERILRLLYESGCTTGLGPYFANPMKMDDLEAWVSRGEFTRELRVG